MNPTIPIAWYWNRWCQLVLGLVAMMAISSPQYVWTLFTGPLNQKLGTTLDFGSLTGTYNRVSTNAGQLALIAANAGGQAYDFELQLEPNLLAGQTTTGDLYKVSGIVTEAGAFDLSQAKVSSCTFTIDLNSVLFTAGS